MSILTALAGIGGLIVTCNPASCSDTAIGGAPQTARVTLTANNSVSWTFAYVSGPVATAFGASSGITTYVELTASADGTSVYDVTADGTVTTRITLNIGII